MQPSDLVTREWERIRGFLGEDDGAFADAWVALRERGAEERAIRDARRLDLGFVLGVGLIVSVVVVFSAVVVAQRGVEEARCAGWCARENQVGAYTPDACTCMEPIEQAVWRPK